MTELVTASDIFQELVHEDVTVYNLYQYIHYKHNSEKNMLCICWDCNDNDVNSLMEAESFTRDDGKFCSHMWVDEIKKCSGWIKGDRLYLRTLYFYNGMFCVKYKHHSNGVYAYEEIDEDGFLLLRNYNDNNGYYGELHQVDCVYNKLHNA